MALIGLLSRFASASAVYFIVLTLIALAPAQSQAGLILGVAAGNYIVVYSGTGGRHLAINNFGAPWTGDIGIAGTGTLQASGPGTLNGDVNFAGGNSSQAKVNNTTINGTIHFDVAPVPAIMNELTTLSSNLGALAGSGTELALNTKSLMQVVLASEGALVAGNRLFTVNSVDTHNGENLVIRGDGSQSVVFNVNTQG